MITRVSNKAIARRLGLTFLLPRILILAGVLVVSVPEFAAGQDPTPSPTPDDAQRVWQNTGTDFNSNASWPGSKPGANDVAAFNAAAVTQPNMSADATIAGLYFT